jgi:DNA-binding phage protein
MRGKKMNSTVVVEDIAQGESFEQFMSSLRDPAFAAPIVSARRFSEALHIDMQTLARQAGVHRNTLSRTPASESVQRFLREALRVIRAATDIHGCVKQALFWYRNEPLSEFEYKTAEQLVSSGRTDDVLKHIVSNEMQANLE